MSFSYDTLIAVSADATKAIQDFAINDPVWAAQGADLKLWAQKPVLFSSGTSPVGRNEMIKIVFDNPQKGTTLNYLLVTNDQPFLMSSKALKRASMLVPGQDVLVLANGSTCAILEVIVGMFDGGIHHISTSTQPAKNLDGHLLLANGIVVGDYATQIDLESFMSDFK